MAAMSRRAFRVVVTREDGQWLADVPDLPGHGISFAPDIR